MVAAGDADPERFGAAVRNSLDRKVCNTLNVCCVVRSRADELVPRFLEAVTTAGADRSTDPRVHATDAAMTFVPTAARTRLAKVVRADGVHEEPFVTGIDLEHLGHEWEWEESPEVTLHVVDEVDEAVRLCNEYSPHFVATLISSSPDQHDRFWATVHAGARVVELGRRPHARQGSDLVGRLRVHGPLPCDDHRPRAASLTASAGRNGYDQTPLMSTIRWTSWRA
jgi:glutamate-5-semialdehyde dehydrogenase